MPRSDGATTWHIVTGEFPPDVGGVADYTANVAPALAGAGDQVHVWTSGTSGTTDGPIPVHRVFGSFSGRDLTRGSDLLDVHGGRSRLLIQWVPHAFGRRGVNLRFPNWLHTRSVRCPDPIDVMLHEPFMPFAGSLARHAAAAAQRLMTATVLRAATRIFVGTPAWIDKCSSFVKQVPVQWTPIPSGVPVAANAADATAFRQTLHLPDGASLIGCFGRAGEFQEVVLDELGRALQSDGENVRILLIGLGSEAASARLIERRPALGRLVQATGTTDHHTVSAALRACDVMVQPYVAGICARHSGAAAVLSHARPMVTNRGPFTEPLWLDSRAVMLSPSGEPASIATTVLRLLEDGVERERLSRAARDLYDARFDVRHTVAALRS
jgi:glycosyltransferase involved in cell wall biosynthesis